jgi:signal transduction histidine kinase
MSLRVAGPYSCRMTWSRPPGDGADPGRRRSEPGGGVAVLVALAQAGGTALLSGGQPGVLGYALLVVSGLVLAGRQRNPRGTLTAVAAMTVGYSALQLPAGPTFLALIVAAAAAARTGHRVALALTTAAAYGAWVALTGPDLGGALAVAAWGAGISLGIEFVLVVVRTVRQAEREKRELRAEQERRRASEERLRIAQELHDVLGHHLSLINVRAGVGSHLLDRRPEEARAALDTIKQASAEALREVQSVLAVLNPADRAAPRAPAPGLGSLDDLTGDAGLPVEVTVEVTVEGPPAPLPAGVDLAAYRIVQEALTNVRRHAGPGATAAVAVEHRPGSLVVQVDDTGGGFPAAAGNGITGMRERATTLGGTLSAGPAPGGGWRVRAALPVPGPEAPTGPATTGAGA